MGWARLLRRVLDLDLERCPQCGGEFKIIAAIEEPAMIARAPPTLPGAAAGPLYLYVVDRYLDPGVDLKVQVNTYRREDVKEFIESYGFDVQFEQDEYTKDEPQLAIDHPDWRTFVKATRRTQGCISR